MQDITALFITSNKVPQGWAEYHKQIFLEAIGDMPLITISRVPMELGVNLLDEETPSPANFYRQILRACKVATTPFIAIIEDDTLYNKEHFLFRPPLDTFGYNICRWSVATWGEPIYSYRDSCVGASTIAPRQEMIDALEEKFFKFGDLPPMKIGEPGAGGEKALGVKERKSVRFATSIPIIQFNHDYFSNADNTPENIRRRHRKMFGKLKAYDIPYWGMVSELVQKFQ